jgi:uncharacterized iron-regulated protein
MKFFRPAVLVAVFCLCAHARADAGPQFLKVSNRQTVDLSRFLADVADSGAVFIGEAHDDVLQHRQQLDIIRGLHARKVAIAIGMEAFAADAQQQLDDWVQGKMTEEKFRDIYAAQWSYDWGLYRDIFIFARDNRIPMIALNVPKRVASKVVRSGPAALTAADKKDIPPEVTWTLNPRQTEYLARIRSQIFGNRPAPIPLTNFAAAQALRNEALAWNISRFREKSPKSTIVVIAGTWHAIRNGAPQQLKKYGDPRTLVVLPLLPEIDPQKMTPEEADYFLLR